MDIVLVDDHPAVRAGLRGLFADAPDLRVAASAGTAYEGLQAIKDLQPAVALLDLHLPGDDGLALCLRARMLPTPPRVILYSAFADASLAVRAAIAGADAVVPKSAASWSLVKLVRRAAAGGVRPAIDGEALRSAGELLDPGDLPILGMLAHGVPPAEVAETLGIAPEWLTTRRWAMLAQLDPMPRRRLTAA